MGPGSRPQSFQAPAAIPRPSQSMDRLRGPLCLRPVEPTADAPAENITYIRGNSAWLALNRGTDKLSDSCETLASRKQDSASHRCNLPQSAVV